MSRVHLATAQTIASILAGERRWIEADTIGDYSITDGKTFLVARVTHVEKLGGHWIGSLDPWVVRATGERRELRAVPVASDRHLRAVEAELEAAVAARWTGDEDDEEPA